jgi:hypothetical protein
MGGLKKSVMEIDRALSEAELLLPGAGAIIDEADPRWQALLSIRRHAGQEPAAVWEFVKRWGGAAEETLRHGVAVCLLQELLAQHFLAYFPLVEERVREEYLFADTFRRCGKYGQAALPAQGELFDALARFAAQCCGAGVPVLGAEARAMAQGLQ